MAEDKSDEGLREEALEGLSRRELLKRAGLAVGAAVVVPVLPAAAAQLPAPAAVGTVEALKTLTRLEYDTLDAICSRIIPTDANGPGAKEARAARFIDWGLSGALGNARDQYASGLAAVEALCDRLERRAVLQACRRRIRTPWSPTCLRTGFPRRPQRFLQHAADAHDSRHVFGSVLRRKCQLRRLGS